MDLKRRIETEACCLYDACPIYFIITYPRIFLFIFLPSIAYWDLHKRDNMQSGVSPLRIFFVGHADKEQG